MSTVSYGGLDELRVPSPLELLDDARLTVTGVRLWLKRDDLIHPELVGNKWRKLTYNLQAAGEQGQTTLLTFGGAYSNHLRAVAAAGRICGFSTIGVVRGEEHRPLNPSLAYAVAHGMRLIYLDRATYRDKTCPAVLAQLHEEFGDFYLLPEGGSNGLAVRGCVELPAEITQPFDLICCPVGTGGTLAGIAGGLRPGQRAVGFAVLKGGQFLADAVADLQRETFGRATENWRLEYGYHFGGFAKRTHELDAFIAEFRERHGIELEWVYVAKMLYGLFDLVQSGRIAPGTVVAVITGAPGP